jgi:hypothetical protein
MVNLAMFFHGSVDTADPDLGVTLHGQAPKIRQGRKSGVGGLLYSDDTPEAQVCKGLMISKVS